MEGNQMLREGLKWVLRTLIWHISAGGTYKVEDENIVWAVWSRSFWPLWRFTSLRDFLFSSLLLYGSLAGCRPYCRVSNTTVGHQYCTRLCLFLIILALLCAVACRKVARSLFWRRRGLRPIGEIASKKGAETLELGRMHPWIATWRELLSRPEFPSLPL